MDRGPTRSRAYAASQSYVHALITVGLAPLLIPPAPEAALAVICSRLDGLLLPGGGDLDPAIYGEQRQPYCDEPEPERDAMELALTTLALDRDLPVFGICRGMQTLNVARGGTLYQDLAAQRPDTDEHDMHRLPRDTRAHAVTVEHGSRLAEALGVERMEVNSLHHQAAREPGRGVRFVARANDGVAEGMELPEYRFALAVQYHPEELFATDELSRRLFAAFARACQER
jgi:putative glutamine amidotransferase